MYSRVSLAVHCLSQSSQAWPIWRLPAVFHSFVEGLVLHSHLDHKDEVSLVLWCYKCSFHCGLKTTAEPGAGTPRLIAWKICSTWFTTDWRRRSFTTEELLGSLSAHLPLNLPMGTDGKIANQHLHTAGQLRVWSSTGSKTTRRRTSLC